MAGPICSAVDGTSFDGLGKDISTIADALKDNIFVTCVATFVMLVLVMVVAAMGMMSVSALANYYRNVRKPANSKVTKDDEVYKSEVEVPDDTVNDEYAKIQTKISKITNTYKAYNREVSRYAMSTRDTRPDDVIDKRILSRKDDDFHYGGGGSSDP